jgi:hypothetical protein
MTAFYHGHQTPYNAFDLQWGCRGRDRVAGWSLWLSGTQPAANSEAMKPGNDPGGAQAIERLGQEGLVHVRFSRIHAIDLNEMS